jgi:hypothetical protein
MITPGVVSFSGASGRVELNESGDRSVSSSNLRIENIKRAEPHQTVAIVTVGVLSSGVVTLDEEQPIYWPDGSIYPEVTSHRECDSNLQFPGLFHASKQFIDDDYFGRMLVLQYMQCVC